MARANGTDLLDDLARVRWDVALRTYGNNHATLIGLLVEWWIAGASDERWALEGGPSYAHTALPVGERGQCDAILGEGGTARGVIEVEGTRHTYTIEKLGKFFSSQHSDYASLEFGIFLAYAYGPVGKGSARTIPPLPADDFLAPACAVTAQHPGKELVVLTLDKEWEPQQAGPRARNDYYGGRPSRVRGWLVADGLVVASRQFVPPTPELAVAGPGRLAPQHFTGCLLGSAVGDALGAPVEALGLPAIRAHFGPTGIAEYAPAYSRLGTITAGTQLALFTAEGLLRADNRQRAKGIWSSPPDMIHLAYLRWLETQGEQVRYPFPEVRCGYLLTIPALCHQRTPGNTSLTALRAGQPHPAPHPVNSSKGGAALARVAPVGLALHSDPTAAFDLGCQAALFTHGHPTGILAAGFLAALIAAIISGASLDAAINLARGLLSARPEQGECLRAVDGAIRLARTSPATPESVERLGAGWVADEALAIALFCALTARDFRSGVTLAVNHSGDSDSTGAITGNILGALWGRNAIPATWLAGLELRSVVEEVAEDLYRHFGPDPGALYGDGAGDEPLDWEKYPGW